MTNKKKAYVDYEGIQEFYYNTIATTLKNTYLLSESQKELFAQELDEALDNADFSSVQCFITDEK